MKATTIKVTHTIEAPPEMVFEMLTQASGLREWFCREARTDPRKGGRFRVGWWSGYEAHGTFTTFSPPRRLGFTWLGRGEPGETNMRITLKSTDGGTKVTLTHSGFGTGKKWAGQADGAAREWNRVLDNLRSVLETGVDLRETRRPRIGLGFESVKDGAGIVLTEVTPDAPAHKAGLQKGDVLIRFGGQRIRNAEEFMRAFGSCRARQRVRAIYLRDGKRGATTVELGARPVPEIPDDPAVLIRQVRQAHEQAIAALRASVMLLTDEQAGQSPAEGEWSIKQTLVHLCASEHGFQAWVTDVLLGNETGWIEARLPEQIAAVFATAPTVSALLDRLERDLTESRAMVTALTPEHRAYKLRYRRIAQMLLAFVEHTSDHTRQIQATARAVQGR